MSEFHLQFPPNQIQISNLPFGSHFQGIKRANQDSRTRVDNGNGTSSLKNGQAKESSPPLPQSTIKKDKITLCKKREKTSLVDYEKERIIKKN